MDLELLRPRLEAKLLTVISSTLLSLSEPQFFCKKGKDDNLKGCGGLYKIMYAKHNV